MNDNTTITISKREPYTVISNSILRDNRITLEARGLLCNLLSNADGWNISVRAIVSYIYDPEELGIMKTGHGKTQIYRIFKELIAAGYMTRERIYEDGKVTEWQYTVYNEPQDAEATISQPTSRKPKSRKSTNRKPEHLRSNNQEEITKEKKEQGTPQPAKPTPEHYANMEARDELANLSPTLQAMATAVSDVCHLPIDASIVERSYQLIGMDATPELVRELFSGAGCYWLTEGAGAWHDGNGRVYPKNIVNDWHWALQWKETNASGGAWAELYEAHIAPLQSVDGNELKERVRLLPFDIKERLGEIGVKQAGQIARLSLAQFAGGA